MIASICKVWRRTIAGDAATATSTDPAQALTRSEFLRAMAAGVVASAGLGSQNAFAAKAASIAPVTDIDRLYDAWQSRLNAGDLDGLVDLYVSDVLYVNPEGKEMTGKSAVRADFQALIALQPKIVLGDRRHLVHRDIALTTNHWKLDITNPDGTRQALTGGGIEVLRKQADGGWRYIIDDASRSAS
ncbi:MAG: SgcJ/EcaC family oxidoreductase [Pseudomonadota bacterium]|nr:SgcJ/EcaC family oxidoreductase [Pseudomonadota bacterium]